ncbi:hypothetical protein PVAND_001891 [Polypedilum vanderplanki]|uniref:Methionine--tRNA ligase, mitochondrial n=1 Tax=Polypedilum vanderplanki TaxID=319348 RepID=A0A9J6BPR1_POLVA|nr:hypothetical protein PVAND_001891 [Polypedilum vanderplanki]
MNKIIFRKFSNLSNGFFITTPIYYVNASPHLGHLYTSLIADTINRFEKLTATHSDYIFSTGTDEHGEKVLRAAKQNNSSVTEYCKNISEKYKSLFRKCDIEFTDYVRTTEDRHSKAVTSFWSTLVNNKAIYKADYSGWYCVPDETFLTESQLITDNSGKKFSLESGHPVEWTSEENYMFKLSKYQDEIIYWARQDNRVIPTKFNKILLDMLYQEILPDLSVSRPSTRMSWGISVPNDDSQNIYVWLDALVNYLTVAGYPDQLRLWPPNVQVIGKDILKFHGIYWPAFLIAANINSLPEQLLVHSHWTVEGQKMSKSKMNVIDPNERASLYTMEGIRYFLLREGTFHNDGNYSDTKITRILNSELADTMGNLLSRACAKSLNPKQQFPQVHQDQLSELIKLDSCKMLFEKLSEMPDKCRQHYTEYNFHFVVDTIMSTLHAANGFFETTKPWLLKNSVDKSQQKRLETIIAITFECLRICGIALQPIVPSYMKFNKKLRLDSGCR